MSPCCDAEDAGVLQGRGPSLAHCLPYKKQMGLEQAPLHHGSPRHLGDLPCDRDKCTLELLHLVLQHYHVWPPRGLILCSQLGARQGDAVPQLKVQSSLERWGEA